MDAFKGLGFEPGLFRARSCRWALWRLRISSGCGDCFEGLYSWLALAGGLPEVILELQAEPEVGLGAEGCGETQGHVQRDGGTAVDEARERGASYAEVPGDVGNSTISNIVGKNAAWMGWVAH